jgi:hypothetical protein
MNITSKKESAIIKLEKTEKQFKKEIIFKIRLKNENK